MIDRRSTILIAAIGLFLLLALALGVQAITAEDWAQAQAGTIRVLRAEGLDTSLDDWATRGYGAGIAESTPTPAGYLPLVSHRVSAFRSPDGDICEIDAECESGWCTDGVCCGTACSGVCQACAASLNGGVDGVCGSVPAGTDPDSECEPYLCGGSGACTTSCTDDSDCASGYYCDDTNTCVPKEENGSACVDNIECESGWCTDLVCCDTSCGGTCEACIAAWNGGVDGTCGFILADWDPDNECPGESTCDGSGVCTGG